MPDQIDMNSDTIVARATALGTAGVAIIRMSGPDAPVIAERIFSPQAGGSFCGMAPRYAVTGKITDSDRTIDHCIAIRFEAPRSFTGEHVVEFHVHGSMLVTELVVQRCTREGARPALPGEFTQRAFLNGKVDLTQVEALADVISSESERALFVAQRQLHGELRDRLNDFRSRLLKVLALLELELDFVQEGYEFTSVEEVNSLLQELRAFVDRLLDSYQIGSRLRNGPRLLLLGRPNAGKSSLFNALVGYQRALVSGTPGTTRDYLEEPVSYAGVQFRLVDTAGLRTTDDVLEAEGVARARDLVATCDHVLYLIDASRDEDPREELADVERMRPEFPGTTFTVVFTKSDLCRRELNGSLACSVFDRASINRLLDELTASYNLDLAESVALVTARQRHHLNEIQALLATIRYESTHSTELLSADLRGLLHPLSELTGEVATDDILATLFSSFCIGK